MKLIDVEYTFDNNKILFYFTADGRIDFRELVKDLASILRPESNFVRLVFGMRRKFWEESEFADVLFAAILTCQNLSPCPLKWQRSRIFP